MQKCHQKMERYSWENRRRSWLCSVCTIQTQVCISVNQPVDWEAAHEFLQVDRSVGEVEWAKPGTTAAYRTLESFCNERLRHFNSDRNNPNKQALSNLSPWIHFGQWICWGFRFFLWPMLLFVLRVCTVSYGCSRKKLSFHLVHGSSGAEKFCCCKAILISAYCVSYSYFSCHLFVFLVPAFHK